MSTKKEKDLQKASLYVKMSFVKNRKRTKEMTENKEKSRLFTNPVFVVICALLCCALWGSATPFIKMGYAVMFEGGSPDIPSTILFAGIRFALAGFITVLIYSIARKKVLYRLRRIHPNNRFSRYRKNDIKQFNIIISQ